MTDDDGLVTWAQVVVWLPDHVVEAIVAADERPAGAGLLGGLRAWWDRPRGFAGVLAATAAGMASTLGAMTGRVQHTVQRGDTLSAIAQRYGTNVAALAVANGLGPGQWDRLQPGQLLRIPTEPAW